MKRVNRDGPPALGGFKTPRKLEPEVLRTALERREYVIDLRRADDYAESHVPGTISIPLTRAFAGYAGWVLPYDHDIYLLTGGADEGPARTAAAELAMIGIDRVAGWLGSDAVASWTATGGEMAASKRVAPNDVAQRVADGASVVDVRSTPEWKTGHLANSVHAQLGGLLRYMADKPRSKPVVLLCNTGSRSSIGASLLEREGFTDVSNLVGGITAWRRDGLPTEVDTVVFASTT